MKKTANELLDSMQDTRFSETEFLSFVENLKNQNQNSDNSFINTMDAEKLWTNTLKDVQRLDVEADKWVNESQNIIPDSKVTFWDDLHEEWNEASKYF
jgi:hypothetical protein